MNAVEGLNLVSKDANRLLRLQRDWFQRNPYPSLDERLDRLHRLRELVESNEAEIAAAINDDFGGRSTHETALSEVYIVVSAIQHACAKLPRWMKQRRVRTQLPFWPASNSLLPQPLGVVGIVSPWNYPLQLLLAPAVAAIAAGNQVMLKPSELTPRFSALLERLVSKSFEQKHLAVVTGDANLARSFVSLPFDHLVFTGSTKVGLQVAQAAACNLTPVTLELGGKSPAIFDESCDLGQAIPRLAFGKLLNAGQTCIAPDYLMVPKGKTQDVAKHLREAIAKMYPSLVRNADYSAIVTDRHRDRLLGLLADAKEKGAFVEEVNPASESFAGETRKLPPTLVSDLDLHRSPAVMQEEIFGPILPIIEYEHLDEAIAYVNARERPLALYWFGRSAKNRDRVLTHTHAGGVTVNDCLWHLAQENQPFGGVGASGTGAYHGHWGFERFSHLKPIFKQSPLAGGALLRPPYGRTFNSLLKLLRAIA